METDRLYIRPMDKSDEKAFINGIEDRALRVAYGFPENMDDTVPPQIFRQFCSLSGAYSIIEKPTDRMVGFLLNVESELPETAKKTLQGTGRTLAFAIFKSYQRQGYMAETLNAYIHLLFLNSEVSYIHCGHFTDNEPSRLLLEKIGFKEYGNHAVKERVIIDCIKAKD